MLQPESNAGNTRQACIKYLEIEDRQTGAREVEACGFHSAGLIQGKAVNACTRLSNNWLLAALTGQWSTFPRCNISHLQWNMVGLTGTKVYFL